MDLRSLVFSPSGLIFFGLILSGVGALWQSREQARTDGEARAMRAQLAHLQAETFGQLTGGGSWPLLTVPTGTDRRDGKLFVQVVGRYPIPEASVRVVDVGEAAPSGGTVLLSQALGSLPVVGVAEGPAVRLPAGVAVDLNVFTWTRHAMYTQQVRMRWLGDHWASADRVTAMGGEILYQGFSDDFPRAVLEAQGWDLERRDRLAVGSGPNGLFRVVPVSSAAP